MIKEKGFDHATGPGVQHEGFDIGEKISQILQGSASE